MKRKQITTTFREDLLKEAKMLALELECNVNDILEVAYQYLVKNTCKSYIQLTVENNKKGMC